MRLVSCIFVLAPLEILAKANKRVIGVLFLTGLAVGASCIPDESRKPPAKSVHKTDVLTVFLTGNELGALKPCGCSGGQLGGFDRRQAVFNSVPGQRRLIVDTGRFVEGDSEQDLIKFNIVIEAFHLLNYDLVNLSEKDIEIAKNLGVLGNPIVGFISAHDQDGERISAKFANRYLLKGGPVIVTVAAFDAESAPIKQISELFTQESDLQRVNILILNRCDAGIIGSVAKSGIVDCLVCPSESDEPMVISDPNKRPLVVSVGRYGKYVGKLEIKPCESADKLKLSFSSIPVMEDLPRGESLVELYKIYQQLVKEANLLEKHPRFVLPNGFEYSGSESCKPCHEYEYEKWSNKPHAHAYVTLERVGSQFDPECVVCHVVGMEYESGFVSAAKTGYLKNVGCESCHGPGSEHIRTLGKGKTTGPRLACADCHTPETSGDYGGNEELYFEKIIHWREPNAGGDVK